MDASASAAASKVETRGEGRDIIGAAINRQVHSRSGTNRKCDVFRCHAANDREALLGLQDETCIVQLHGACARALRARA